MKNNIRIDGKVAYITVKSKGQEIEFIVDAYQLPKLQEVGYSLSLHNRGYGAFSVYQGKGKAPKLILLHRLLADAPEGSVVDHLNSNMRDNRLANLRIGTQADNLANMTGGLVSNVEEKYVFRDAQGYYRVKIQRGGKIYWRKRKTLESAVEARDQLLKELA